MILRLNELPIEGVAVFQPLQINLLDDILAQASNPSNLLVGEDIERQQVTSILVELLGHPVVDSFERDILTFCCSTVRTTKLVVGPSQGTQMASNGKALKRDVGMVIDVHTTTTMLTDSFLCGDFQRAVVDKDRTA